MGAACGAIGASWGANGDVCVPGAAIEEDSFVAGVVGDPGFAAAVASVCSGGGATTRGWNPNSWAGVVFSGRT